MMRYLARRNLIWRMKTSLLSLIFTICYVTSMSVTGYGAAPPDYSTKDTLVVCISSTILSLDPTNHRDRDTQMVLKNMFDSLTIRDKDLKVVPQLAESWQAIDDRTWEFRLRKDVMFHNGNNFSATDVKFTLDRVTKVGALDGQTSPRKSLLGRISEVTIIDSHTVHIITEKPWPTLPLMLTLQEILPAAYISRVGSKEFENRPVGTGPFKFVEKTDESLVLERFEEYYGGSPSIPPTQVAPLKNILFKTVTDRIKRTALLKKGQADIATNIPLEAIPLFDMLPDISIMNQPATRSYFADLNCLKPPFNNPQIRIAMNYAMDMRMIVNSLFRGKAQILPTILLQQAFSFNDQLVPYPYNPERAKEILKESDFTHDYIVKIVCIEKYSKFANAISLFLSRIGMKSNITIDQKKVVRAAMKNLKADILVTSWGNTTLDPVGILLPKLKSGGRGNFSNYSNNELDRLLGLAENSLDLKKRAEYYKKIQKIIHREAPMIFGYASDEFYGVAKRVTGFSPSATGMLNLHDVSVD